MSSASCILSRPVGVPACLPGRRYAPTQRSVVRNQAGTSSACEASTSNYGTHTEALDGQLGLTMVLMKSELLVQASSSSSSSSNSCNCSTASSLEAHSSGDGQSDWATGPLLAVAPLVAIGLLGVAAVLPEASHAAQPSMDIAEQEEEFLGNVVRYGRYFVTVMLGTGYVMLRPIAAMFKNPVSGILAVLLVGGAIFGTKLTLELMLGISDQALPMDAAMGDYM